VHARAKSWDLIPRLIIGTDMASHFGILQTGSSP
jgi:hypothetical protein